jgi:hypothetical protein
MVKEQPGLSRRVELIVALSKPCQSQRFERREDFLLEG